MEFRSEPATAAPQPLSATAVEHILGTVEVADGSILASGDPLTRHRRPLPALTGLRFVAASYVVTFHTRCADLLRQSGYPHLARFLYNGYLAVPLFFVLSGFILAYTYRGQMRRDRSSMRFWEARFARLWPAYAFSLLCSSIPGMVLPRLSLLVATVCMVQAWNPWHPEYAGTWNMVCWTLSVEAFFYLLFPFVQRAVERLRPALLAYAALGVVCVAVLCNVSSHTLGAPVYAPPWSWVPLPVIHLPEFLTGVAAGNFFAMPLKSRPALRRAGRRRWPVLTAIGSLASGVVLASVQGSWTTLILPCFAVLVAGLAKEDSTVARFLGTPALLLGGAISYSVYLLQTPVRSWVHAAPGFQTGRFTLFYVPLLLYPFAWLAYRFVEEPSRLRLRHVFATGERAAGSSRAVGARG